MKLLSKLIKIDFSFSHWLRVKVVSSLIWIFLVLVKSAVCAFFSVLLRYPFFSHSTLELKLWHSKYLLHIERNTEWRARAPKDVDPFSVKVFTEMSEIFLCFSFFHSFQFCVRFCFGESERRVWESNSQWTMNSQKKAPHDGIFNFSSYRESREEKLMRKTEKLCANWSPDNKIWYFVYWNPLDFLIANQKFTHELPKCWDFPDFHVRKLWKLFCVKNGNSNQGNGMEGKRKFDFSFVMRRE